MEINWEAIPRGVPPPGSNPEGCQIFFEEAQCPNVPVTEVIFGCEGERIRRNRLCWFHGRQHEDRMDVSRCRPCGMQHFVQLLAIRSLAEIAQ